MKFFASLLYSVGLFDHSRYRQILLDLGKMESFLRVKEFSLKNKNQ